MSNLNKVMLIGRLTRDPEMRYTPSGQPVTSFGLATNRYGGGTEGEKREFTDFHDIVVWNIGKRTLAELVAQYTRKGSLIYIEGRLQTRSWEGQDGRKQYKTEVVANDVQFLETRSTNEDAAAAPAAIRVPAGAASYGSRSGVATGDTGGQVRDVDPDEIPF